MEQPILVTGATGFIGNELILRLLADNFNTYAFVLPNESINPQWASKVKIFRGDISDFSTLEPAIEKAKTIIHLAAMVGDWGKEEIFQKVSVQGTENVFKLAHQYNLRVILVSSIAVYGKLLQTQECSEETPHGPPLGPYSRSKQAQERLAWKYLKDKDLALTIIRPSNVYGPGSRPWLFEVMKQLKKGLPTLISGGKHNAGLCYVDHVVDVLIRAASNPKAIGKTYNICDPTPITWQQYFSDLAVIGKTPIPKSIPKWIAKPATTACECLWKLFLLQKRPPLTYEALNLISADFQIPIQKVQEDLGFQPFVTYQEGLEKIAHYWQSL